MTTDRTPAELAAEELGRHRISTLQPMRPHCAKCGLAWPCDASWAATQLAEEQAKVAARDDLIRSLEQDPDQMKRADRLESEVAALAETLEALAHDQRVAETAVPSVDQIAEALIDLFGRAFPIRDRTDTAYLIEDWITNEGAAALRAALVSVPQKENPEL